MVIIRGRSNFRHSFIATQHVLIDCFVGIFQTEDFFTEEDLYFIDIILQGKLAVNMRTTTPFSY